MKAIYLTIAVLASSSFSSTAFAGGSLGKLVKSVGDAFKGGVEKIGEGIGAAGDTIGEALDDKSKEAVSVAKKNAEAAVGAATRATEESLRASRNFIQNPSAEAKRQAENAEAAAKKAIADAETAVSKAGGDVDAFYRKALKDTGAELKRQEWIAKAIDDTKAQLKRAEDVIAGLPKVFSVEHVNQKVTEVRFPELNKFNGRPQISIKGLSGDLDGFWQRTRAAGVTFNKQVVKGFRWMADEWGCGGPWNSCEICKESLGVPGELNKCISDLKRNVDDLNNSRNAQVKKFDGYLQEQMSELGVEL